MATFLFQQMNSIFPIVVGLLWLQPYILPYQMNYLSTTTIPAYVKGISTAVLLFGQMKNIYCLHQVKLRQATSEKARCHEIKITRLLL